VLGLGDHLFKFVDLETGAVDDQFDFTFVLPGLKTAKSLGIYHLSDDTLLFCYDSAFYLCIRFIQDN
jgi:hypothetical protein